MTRATAKDAAFADTLKARLREVYFYFRRLGVGPYVAEDLAQDTFVVAWQNLHKVSDDGIVRSWLYGIAYRRYLQHRDRMKAARIVQISEQIEADPAHDPGNDQSQTCRAVRDAVLSLAPKYRHPLVLVYWQDLSYQEAAHALSLRMGTFAWRVRRALKLVRERLAEKEVADDATSSAT